MKKIVLLIGALCCLLSGCSVGIDDKEASVSANPDAIAIIVRATSVDSITKSNVNEPVVFTGNDILWFNEVTKEMRFKDNLAMKSVLSNVQALKFYLRDEYLFPSIIVNSLSSQIINSLVFYYNILENKYFLLDGYPPGTFPSSAEDVRDINTQNMASDWNKFIDQLKKEGKYK